MTKKFDRDEEKKLRNCGYIQFAQVGRPHGLKGAFFLKTEDKRTEWDGYKSLLIETPEGFIEKKVLKTYLSGNALAIVLDGFENRNHIEPLYNNKIYVHKDQIPLNEDEYLVGNLVGYKVYSEDKGFIGTIQGVSSYGAQDNLEISVPNSNKIFLFPFIDFFIKQINENEERIDIIYVPEFFEDDSK
ncbi:ribosome maturation factor RimM [Silvanigrella aquatica]|uniref:Ribosome maturation factor RimM n=1 Tax=Silvanigrella aquatica TaxID=1915309 RepID=A0A1L4CYA2_9BACT|nr:ribosome maturation factor RimM [Silvanigrella aquatica]APJ02917.1 16S rRNA processing protein RimM [Silvanigrella aquatica]